MVHNAILAHTFSTIKINKIVLGVGLHVTWDSLEQLLPVLDVPPDPLLEEFLYPLAMPGHWTGIKMTNTIKTESIWLICPYMAYWTC